MRSRLLLLSICLSLTAATAQAQQELQWSGFLPGDTTFTSDAIHHITGHLTVPQAITLTIQAGAVLKFDAEGRLRVEGTLVARGTADAPILFTSSLPSPYPGS